MRLRLLTFAAFLALPAAVSAQDADGPGRLEGAWKGTLELPGGASLRLIFRFDADESGALSASMESPDQGEGLTPAASASLEGDAVTIEFPTLKGRYRGTLAESGDDISGTWSQLGEIPLALERVKDDTKEASAPEVPAALEGLWVGTLKVNGVLELRVVLRAEREGDGPLVASVQSPDQTMHKFPVSDLSLEGDTLKFSGRALGASYEGTKEPIGEGFAGTFKQGGAEFPLTLVKTDKIEAPRRPQEPKPPFPYELEEVTYPNPEADLTLAGTLTLPEGDGPFPAALLITGSGPQDRDETLLGHKPFWILADALTRRGIAVLRFDDRGTAKSTGTFKGATTRDFASDAAAGVAFLRQHPKIDPARVGLIGHSEGGLVAPLVAADSEDVAFVVLIAGPGVPGSEILAAQSDLIGRAMGSSAEEVAKDVGYLKEALAIIVAEADEEAASAQLRELAKRIVAGLDPAELKQVGGDESLIVARFEVLNDAWFRFFLGHDPRPTLAKVACPVLAINGGTDLQVPPDENLAEVAKALESGGNTDVTIRKLPGLNHLLQTSETGSPAEYAKIEETMAPAALEVIGDWIVEKMNVH